MTKPLRRMFWLSVAAGGGYAAWTWNQRRAQDLAAAPEWPVLDGTPAAPDAGTRDSDSSADTAPDTAVRTFASVDTPSPAAATPPGQAAGSDDPGERRGWVDPVDGECPDGYPVKANDNSGIYHVPGGRFYGRTVPERCYARTDDAEADGYRASKA